MTPDQTFRFDEQSARSILPADMDRALLVGRANLPGEGPVPVVIRDDKVFDVSGLAPTVSSLFDGALENAALAEAEPGPVIGKLHEILNNSVVGARDSSKPFFLAPIDLQCIKACGVTFAVSAIERCIEERAGGSADQALAIRERIASRIGEGLSAVRPGSPEAAELKKVLQEEGLWSQYLEVAIGPDAEVFTKAPVLSAVGFGEEIGVRRDSDWNNPEPEIVLIVNGRGEICGATLGNDVNLRDFEGRSALLLGKAKDNNASTSLGPFIRLFTQDFTLDTVREALVRMRVAGKDGYLLDASSDMTQISRDPVDLVRQVIGPNHQYPDGFALFLGTLFAPTQDRDEAGRGFTHKQGDIVEVSCPALGVLANPVTFSDEAAPWTFGVMDFMNNLSARGLLKPGAPARAAKPAAVSASSASASISKEHVVVAGNAKAHYIGGEWVAAGDAKPNVNPSDTNDIIAHYCCASGSHVDQAVAAAKRAFPAWSEASPEVRSDILDRVGTLMMQRRDELGTLLSREEGKTKPEGVGEVMRAARIFKFFAGEALRLGGDNVPSVRPGIGVEVTREPVGVFGLIAPWNFPIAIPAWKTAPALAFGNCVVLKPAELVPGCSHAMAELLDEAGIPAGVFNLVMGKGRDVGARMVEHPDINGISFTGSVQTGGSIAGVAAARNARMQLEMGGKNPLVILDDADLETAVEIAVNGAYFSTGQRCTASSRLVVTEGIHDAFVEALIKRLGKLKVGHALEDGIDIGPVADQSQFDKVLSYVDIGKQEGAKLAFGGRALERGTPGFYIEPALFTETDNEMRINKEEIFGPVASVIKVRDYDEALAVANDTPFGLSSGIATTSLKYASDFRRKSRAGMVMVNLPTAGVDYHVPFGGTKGSSYGPREQGRFAREFYTVVKTGYVFPG